MFWLSLHPPYNMVGAHALLAIKLIWNTKTLIDGKFTKFAVQKYYQSIWTNFYCEYALLPFL